MIINFKHSNLNEVMFYYKGKYFIEGIKTDNLILIEPNLEAEFLKYLIKSLNLNLY